MDILLGFFALLIVVGIMLATRKGQRDPNARSHYRENYITDSLSKDGSPTNLYGEPILKPKDSPPPPDAKEWKDKLEGFNYESGFLTDQGSDLPFNLGKNDNNRKGS